MARTFGNAITHAEVALTSDTAKCVVGIKAPANQRVVNTKLGVFFDGVKSNDPPIVVELCKATTDGTYTSGSVADTQDYGHTYNTVCGYDWSVEPTIGEVLDVWNIHPQQGIEEILPLMQEFMRINGWLVLRITAPNNVNCLAKMSFEE
jgi:hypothetical protein